jgi:hypothetical protein
MKTKDKYKKSLSRTVPDQTPASKRRSLEKEPEGEEVEKSHLEVRHCRNPVHRLGMDRMQGEQGAGHKGRKAVADSREISGSAGVDGGRRAQSL